MKECHEDACRDLGHHELHVCQLHKQGLQAELASRTNKPAFICHNCNAEANLAGDLCNPSPLVQR